MCRKANRKSQKLSPFKKWVKIYKVYPLIVSLDNDSMEICQYQRSKSMSFGNWGGWMVSTANFWSHCWQNSAWQCFIMLHFSLSPFYHLDRIDNFERDIKHHIIIHFGEVSFWKEQASVAQSDEQLTGDQEVTGLILVWSATSFREDWSWSIFCCHSSIDSRRAFVSFWWEDVHKYWLTAYCRGLSLPRKKCG